MISVFTILSPVPVTSIDTNVDDDDDDDDDDSSTIISLPVPDITLNSVVKGGTVPSRSPTSNSDCNADSNTVAVDN